MRSLLAILFTLKLVERYSQFASKAKYFHLLDFKMTNHSNARPI